jgi:hypothetical protein
VSSVTAFTPQEAKRVLSWGRKIGYVLLLASGILFAAACGVPAAIEDSGKIFLMPELGKEFTQCRKSHPVDVAARASHCWRSWLN